MKKDKSIVLYGEVLMIIQQCSNNKGLTKLFGKERVVVPLSENCFTGAGLAPQS